MLSITGQYLADLIATAIQMTISLRRHKLDLSAVTKDEVIDFIISIPYFDLRLKDFILGNLPEQYVIIEADWEIEFIKKCRAWSLSLQWLQDDIAVLNSIYGFVDNNNLLTLPN